MVADANDAHWTLGQYGTGSADPPGPLEIAVAHARFEYKRRAACGNKEPGSPAGKVYDTDPDSAWVDRAVIRMGTWLPIDWLL
jgi:hypothetical protein